MNNLIAVELKNYLGGTRLSMDQVAKKWSISTAMLSQIKNGKKRAGIDLGLKILRESGADFEERKNWLESRHKEESKEYHLLKEETQKRKLETNLQNDFSKILESQPVLLDIFLDIALAEDVGISWNSIYKNYGDHGADLVMTLVESKIVLKKEDKFYINKVNAYFISDELTSFGIVKAIIELQQNRKRRNQFKGELKYDVTDISKEGYDELITLNKEYVGKVRKILQEKEMHRFAGGFRVVCQSLVSLAKGSFCLLLLLGFLQAEVSASEFSGNTGIEKGGIGGGSSDRVLGGIGGGSSDLIKSIRKPRDFHGRFGIKYKYERTHLYVPHAFDNKQVAIDSIVDLNNDFEKGKFDKKIIRKITAIRDEKCRGTALERIMKSESKKASIKPIGFSISESFNGKGEPRYSVKADYYVPCEIKEKD